MDSLACANDEGQFGWRLVSIPRKRELRRPLRKPVGVIPAGEGTHESHWIVGSSIRAEVSLVEIRGGIGAVKRRTLRVGEVDLELFEAGEGRPLLYLHGFLEPAGWAEHLELFAHDHRVLAPAHPGFAGSLRPEWMESVEDLAYLYLDLIDGLNLHEVHVVGHSLGGWIAAELAVRCSHAIDRLVLVDAVGLRTLCTPAGPAGGSIADWLVLDPATVRGLAWHDEGAMPCPLELPGDPDLSEETLVRVFQDREAASHYGWKPFFHNPRLAHWLHRVSAPTLVVWGAHDGIVPRSVGQAFSDGIPGARLEIVAAAGHLPQLERPRAFVDLVRGFLE